MKEFNNDPTLESNIVPVPLPRVLVERVELLMKRKYERRPGSVEIGAFLTDLVRESIERQEALTNSEPKLEEYLVDGEFVYIMDKKKALVVKLEFRENELFCTEDHSTNCLHVGFAYSIPVVQNLLNDKRS